MLTLVDIELVQLIHQRILERKRAVNEVSSSLFGPRRKLMAILNGSANLTRNNFTKLVYELGVDHDRILLKHWIAGLLMQDAPPEMLRLCEIVGLLEGESRRDADVFLEYSPEDEYDDETRATRNEIADRKGWHFFSHKMQTGVDRFRICREIKEAAKPLSSAELSKRLNINTKAIVVLCKAMAKAGQLSFRRRTGRKGKGLCTKDTVEYVWSLTERGLHDFLAADGYALPMKAEPLLRQARA